VTDTIFIEGLSAQCIIGIFDWERKRKQKITVDLHIPTAVHKGALTDSIEDALDYKKISKDVLSLISKSKFFLVETLIERIAELVLEDTRIDWVQIKLSKPGALRHSTNVGLNIKRTQKSVLRKSSHKVFISLGTNLQRKKNMQLAFAALRQLAEPIDFSSSYKTTAEGNQEQPPFWNAIATFQTQLSPIELKEKLSSIEYKLGRRRNQNKYAPRCIDLDIAFYGNKKYTKNNIPHPDATTSPYILIPMAELSPNFVHPSAKITMLELLGSQLDKKGSFTKV
jgi:2-amino-4-hydroxy-6-hydroxymethyldihydropteridine diphosphokinase